MHCSNNQESVRMDTDEAANDSSNTETDANMEDAKTSDWVDNGVPESVEKPVQMETDNKVEAGKKKVKKINVPVVELVYGGMSAKELQKAVEKEFEMALQDRVMEETEDKKMLWRHMSFVTSSEKDEMIAKLQEVEDWLYEDGEDETKGVYVDKLEKLQKQGNPIEERHKEWIDRGPAT
ncbi:hypothetical protein ZIOFF_002352 [Zingiber officinale]|uniref:Uncharacterized protein n=1 Tax=Zingiber officinale TaxID=94328 RepID=A0A8J5IBD4_ZINOF|nr:hypothetical protein ZIOFF_002352 [Zingiber officinale]